MVILMALSLLIVDDETLARKLLREYLTHHTDIAIVGECENGEEAVDAIARLNPDLILLDVSMPILNGLEVLELTGRTQGVIFTTAYDQHALTAFDLHAVDYLLKPFSQERFDTAIARAKKLLKTSPAEIPALIKDTKIQRIVVRDRGQIYRIPVADIDYIEVQDDYISIHWNGKSILKTQSLRALEAQLDAEEFVRIHRSFMVRLAALKGVERVGKDVLVAVLHDNTKLPISRAGYERIKSKLE
jgi:two-component system, LytTR family, response regulator